MYYNNINIITLYGFECNELGTKCFKVPLIMFALRNVNIGYR